MEQHDGGPGGPEHSDVEQAPPPDAGGAGHGLLPLRSGGEREARPPIGPYVGDPDDVWLTG